MMALGEGRVVVTKSGLLRVSISLFRSVMSMQQKCRGRIVFVCLVCLGVLGVAAYTLTAWDMLPLLRDARFYAFLRSNKDPGEVQEEVNPLSPVESEAAVEPYFSFQESFNGSSLLPSSVPSGGGGATLQRILDYIRDSRNGSTSSELNPEDAAHPYSGLPLLTAVQEQGDLCRLRTVHEGLLQGEEVRLIFVGCSFTRGVTACGYGKGKDRCPACRKGEPSELGKKECDVWRNCQPAFKCKKGCCPCCAWPAAFVRWMEEAYPTARITPHFVGCYGDCGPPKVEDHINSYLREANLTLTNRDVVFIDMAPCETVHGDMKGERERALLPLQEAQRRLMDKLSSLPAFFTFLLNSPEVFEGRQAGLPGLHSMYRKNAAEKAVALWGWWPFVQAADESAGEGLGPGHGEVGKDRWPHPPWQLHYLVADVLAMTWAAQTREAQLTQCPGMHPPSSYRKFI